MTQEASDTGREAVAKMITRYLGILRKSQFMPAEQLRAFQRWRLERLVRHARAHVPFYRDGGRLEPLFRPDDTIDWDRWGEIPLLTRRDVQQAGTLLHSENLPPEHGKTWLLATSGSTGEPVSVLHSALSGHVVWGAVMLRDLERHQIDATRRMGRIRSFLRGENLVDGMRRSRAWFPPLATMGLNGECLEISEFLPLDRIIDELLAFEPSYIATSPLQLELMCAWDRDFRLRALRLQSVTTDAARLSPETKRSAADHLGCNIIDRYSSNECGIIATACPLCDRLHVHAETIQLEVLDEDGSPTDPGQSGVVVVTPLYNYAMPLIRYDHADEATVGSPESCRITLPVLDTVGKAPTLFVFPEGRVIRPRIPPYLVMRDLGAQFFQVAQVAEDRCEFRILPGRLPPSQMRFDDITSLLRTRWWKDLKIDYRILEELPGAGSRRKLQSFVRELQEIAPAVTDGRSSAIS